jgi:hypothetical protein
MGFAEGAKKIGCSKKKEKVLLPILTAFALRAWWEFSELHFQVRVWFATKV